MSTVPVGRGLGPSQGRAMGVEVKQMGKVVRESQQPR